MDKEIDPEISKKEQEFLSMVEAEVASNLSAYQANGGLLTPAVTQSNLDPYQPQLQPFPTNIDPSKDPLPAIPPLNTREGMQARGFIDENENPTELGESFMLLHQGGIMENGELTLKGKALALPKEAVTDGAAWASNGYNINPEAYEIWKKKEALRVDEEEDVGFFSSIKEMGKSLLDTAKSVNIAIGTPFDSVENATASDKARLYGNIDEFNRKKAEIRTVAQAKIVEGAINAPMQFISGATSLSVQAQSVIGDAMGLMTPEEAEEFRLKYKYKHHLTKDLAQKTDAAALAGIFDLEDEVNRLQSNVKNEFLNKYGEKGQEEYQRFLNGSVSAGSMIADPLNLIIPASGNVFQAAKLLKKGKNTKRFTEAFNAGADAQQTAGLGRTAFASMTKEAATISKQLDDAINLGETANVQTLTAKLDEISKSIVSTKALIANSDNVVKEAQKVATAAEVSAESVATMADYGRKAIASGLIAAQGTAKAGQYATSGMNSFVRGVEGLIGRSFATRITSTALLGAAGAASYNILGSGAGIATFAGVLAARAGLRIAPTAFEKAAKFASVLGEEVIQRSSSTPFLQRVAMNQKVGRLTGATANLSSNATPFIKAGQSVAVGTAKALPATALYTSINNGGIDANSLKMAGRDALLFGGVSRLIGRHTDMKKLQQDELFNFHNKLKKDNPESYEVFQGIQDKGVRQFAASFDALYPNKYKWEFGTTGDNRFRPNSDTINVNVNDKAGFLRGLVAHEALHGVQYVHQYEAGIVAKMLGDETNSGLVRSIDGKLDPEFQAWSDKYQKMMVDGGNQPLSLQELAVEFYTDMGTRTLFEEVTSGASSRQSRKTPLVKTIESLYESLMPKAKSVTDIHLKLGGAIDTQGRMVQGSGLLADGFKELPEVRNMVRQAVKDTAGRRFQRNTAQERDVPPSDKKAFESAGEIKKTSVDINRNGKPLPDGILIPDNKGNGEGMLTPEHFKRMEKQGTIENGDFSKALFLQTLMDDANKFPIAIINKPIVKGRSEIVMGETAGQVIPTQWRTIRGRLYLEAMDLVQLDKNVERALKTKSAEKLGMTREKILDDIQETIAIQNQKKPSDDYYKSVDPVNWKERKDFNNAVLGLQKRSQLGTNPKMKEVSPTKDTGIIRTFAFDRVKSVIKMNDNVSIPFAQYSYYNVRDNLMPQTPRFNADGEFVPEKPSKAPVSKPQPTRLAKDIAMKNKVPLSKVKPSGANGEITPNDVREYLAEKNDKFKPLYFRKELKSAIEPTISDMLGQRVKFDGVEGTLIDLEGRPAIKNDVGEMVELPMTFFTEMSLNELGLKLTGKRGIDRPKIISQFEIIEKRELHGIFNLFDETADRISGLAELSQSKARKGKQKYQRLIETPEFESMLRKVTDKDILHAWDVNEKALQKATNAKNLINGKREQLIAKFQENITFIEELSAAYDNFRQQRAPDKITSERPTSKVEGQSATDAIEREILTQRARDAQKRIKNTNPIPAARKMTSKIEIKQGKSVLEEVRNAIFNVGTSASRNQKE